MRQMDFLLYKTLLTLLYLRVFSKNKIFKTPKLKIDPPTCLVLLTLLTLVQLACCLLLPPRVGGGFKSGR